MRPTLGVALEGGEHMQALARGGAGRDHPHVGPVPVTHQIGLRHAPGFEALAPLFRELERDLIEGALVRRRRRRFDPGQEGLAREGWKRQEQVGQIAFDIDQERGHPGAQRLFQHHREQAGLAAARHAHHHSVGDEVVNRQVKRRGCGVAAQRARRAQVPVSG